MNVLAARALKKSYGELEVVRSIDLAVARIGRAHV